VLELIECASEQCWLRLGDADTLSVSVRVRGGADVWVDGFGEYLERA